MKLIALFILLVLGPVMKLLAQVGDDPFYRYGFPQEQIYVDIEQALSEAKEVKKLKLEAVDLSLIADKLDKFRTIKVLRLTNNQIDSLPDRMFEAGSLLYFESIGNSFKHLPANFGKSKGLKELKIINAAIADFPESMSEIRFLRRIEFQSFEVDSVEMLPFLGAQRSLEEVLLYKIPMNDFPIRDSSSTTLKQVYMVNCQLTKIDSSFWNNQLLEVLALDDNKIGEIPEEVLKLKLLKSLSLKNNNLKHLPEFIAKLPALQVLNVSGNKIPYHELEIIRILLPNCKIIY